MVVSVVLVVVRGRGRDGVVVVMAQLHVGFHFLFRNLPKVMQFRATLTLCRASHFYGLFRLQTTVLTLWGVISSFQ